VVGHPFAARLGKNGLAWGLGLHSLVEKNNKNFRMKNYRWEGDGRSPAGVYSLGATFGAGNELREQEYKKGNLYYPISEELQCIEDSLSPHYNQFVIDGSLGGHSLAGTKLPVLAHDAITDSSHKVDPRTRHDKFLNWDPFQLGVFVNQNSGPIKADGDLTLGEVRRAMYPNLGKNMNDPAVQSELAAQEPAPYGSCIYLHIQNPDPANAGTSGCTAMPAGDLRDLIAWRDSRKNPLLVQLPQLQWRDVAVRCGERVPVIRQVVKLIVRTGRQ
jgi:D-alanyl-D-alanine dipeptidase